MQENVEKVFYEEVREKKTAAGGVRGRKGKKGQVGKMITPADIAGQEYREARDLQSFNIYDVLHKLQETPTLKSVLLARMDEEYKNYRQATERTLDAVAEIVQLGLEPLYREMETLRQRVDDLASRFAQDAGRMSASPVASLPSDASVLARVRKKRIRWGSSPDDVRETVFAQLRALVAAGEEISTETIKQRVPSMLRWIYGERAVFEGIEGLRREFFRAMGQQGPEAVTPDQAGEVGVDNLAPGADQTA